MPANGAMKDILTKREVAAMLSVSPKFVQRLVADRKLQSHRLGHKTLRIRREEVERYLRRNTQ